METVLYPPVIQLSVITLGNTVRQDDVEKLIMRLGVVFSFIAAFYSNYIAVSSQLQRSISSAVASLASCVAVTISELAVTCAAIIPVNL